MHNGYTTEYLRKNRAHAAYSPFEDVISRNNVDSAPSAIQKSQASACITASPM
jgi:hypothetical protein